MTVVLPIKAKANAQLLADRVAFVTAAWSGIGRAGAIALAQNGAHVVVTDLDGELAAEVAAEIVSEGHKATSKQLDVTDDDALQTAIDSTIAHFGRFDILHSHAGIQIEGTLEQVSPEGKDASWALNVQIGRAHG